MQGQSDVIVTIRLMEAWLWPLVGIAIVGFTPGLLAFRLLCPHGPALYGVAVAPALSCAILFLYADALGLLGLPLAPWTFAILVGFETLVLTRRRRFPSAPRSNWRVRRVDPGLLLVGLAIVVGALVWVQAIPSGQVPPNHDSMNHSFMAARIAATGSVEADHVIVTNARSQEAMVPFYPVGLHITAALSHRMTGAGLAEIFWALVVLAGAVLLPLGLYCLSVMLFDDGLIGGVSALVSVLLPLFPYKPIAWGGIALIFGMALVPAVVVIVVLVVRSNWSPSGVALAVLALIGLLVVHTSEIPTVLLLASLVLIDGIRGVHRARQWRSIIARLAGIGLLMLMLAVPIAGRAGEDRAVADNPTAAFTGTLRQLLHLEVAIPEGQFRTVMIALGGAVILVARRRPWLVLGSVIIVGLYEIAAVSTSSTLRLLTSPWYRQAERVAYNITLFVALFAGLAIVAAARRTARLAPSSWRGPTVGIAVVLAGLWVAGTAPVHTTRVLRKEINAYSVVGETESEAFRYIARHGGRDLDVLGDEYGDGSLWMYAISGARPVFGIKPPSSSPSYETWQERFFMLTHLTDPGSASRVGNLLAKYCVGFVYYGDRRLYGAGRTLDIAALEKDGRLQESFRKGNTRVFKVKDARCTASGRAEGLGQR